MSSTTIKDRPPANARLITSWRDLPDSKAPASYLVTDGESESRKAIISKNKRRVLEGLMQAPLYCASPVRLSDLVHILKRDYGVNIEMDLYANDRETDRAKFGVYTLKSKVELIDRDRGTC